MDKKNLQNILGKPFTLSNWRDVLVSVFGVKRLHQNPIPIDINKKEKAEAAFELGSFNTSDDRIIGLYLVKVKPEIWLERNKVGLREMLRSVYKHDVDGALIVFEQKDRWRLSFVSEIRVFDENGKISKKSTEPKRYTYLLGAGEKVRTPATRLASLSGKPFSLEDIRNAFSVEALNEEFYKVVARYFYQLVGATEGKGAKAITHQRLLELPSIKPDNNEGHKIYQEFAVRLIGRTVFCWFLKVKKSDKGVALLPEHLLSSAAVTSNSNYYHFILEKLFFQTLNTPMDDRIRGLPKGSEQIPFLNGGLFEPQTEDYYKPNRSTGLSDNLNTLKIPDTWFRDFFEHLEQYNFTIDENSVVDIEVSVDPEMLGRIFENLLAEIDPDSGETARKATGSFYTPREIVDYMANESLVHYLHNRTKIDKERLQPIFKMDSEVSFPKSETEKILEELDRLRILDPACGSGAFPIGVMQKIVMALEKLDKSAQWWINKQVSKNTDPTARAAVRDKLSSNPEYARKIGIIQHSLYGVDIQPIAAEISKLRCFLTLVVDENIDETKPNRGVEPLPNLEFKFVTADALLKLPPETEGHGTGDLFSNASELNELQQIRLDYLQSYGEHKEELKQRFLDLQKEIFKQQLKYGAKGNTRAYQISLWNPFSHDRVDWFDPMWMFGISEFQVIIGNPPYGAKMKDRNAIRQLYSETSFGNTESYKYFIHRYLTSLHEGGLLSFITSDSFLEKENFSDLRSLIISNCESASFVKLGDNVFKNVNLPTSICFLEFGISPTCDVFSIDVSERDSQRKIEAVEHIGFKQVNFTADTLIRFLPKIKAITSKNTFPLIQNYEQVMGVKVYQVGKGKPKQTNIEIEQNLFLSNEQKDNSWLKFIESGIKRYHYTGGEKYIKYGEWLAEPRELRYFINPKIVLREVVNPSPFATLIEEGAVVKNTNAVIIQRNKNYGLKYLLAILNSKLFNYYIKQESPKSKNKLFPSITSHLLKDFPVATCDSSQQKALGTLADYILSLYKIEEPINEYVPNSHIIQLFEEVIDAVVYELYFQESFEKQKISFIRYVQRDFESIEDKSTEDAIKIMHTAYQKLRDRDNEIRQNLKLMDTRLADLIMPIKATK